jgi:hypothetical protein
MFSILKFRNIYILGLLTVITSSGLAYFDWTTNKHMDFRSACNYVNKIKKQDPSTIILVQSGDVYSTFGYYYNRDFFIAFDSINFKMNGSGAFIGNKIENFRFVNFSNAKKVILLQTFSETCDPENTVLNFLNLNFTPSSNKEFEGVKYHEFHNSKNFKSIATIDLNQHKVLDEQYHFIGSIMGNAEIMKSLELTASQTNQNLDQIIYDESLKQTLGFLPPEKSKQYQKIAKPSEETIEQIVFKIKSDSVWSKQIEDRAKEAGISFEEKLLSEAKWIIEQKKSKNN